MTMPPSPPISLATAEEGALLYLVPVGPDALPPVKSGDLADAWSTARQAAASSCWGIPRLFRFQGETAGPIDLALVDDDASCWAESVDRMASLQTPYGLSLCLRLLALVGALAALPWLSPYCRLSRAGAALDPALVRVAATLPLTSQAGFDEEALRARLAATSPPHLTRHLTSSGANT